MLRDLTGRVRKHNTPLFALMWLCTSTLLPQQRLPHSHQPSKPSHLECYRSRLGATRANERPKPDCYGPWLSRYHHLSIPLRLHIPHQPCYSRSLDLGHLHYNWSAKGYRLWFTPQRNVFVFSLILSKRCLLSTTVVARPTWLLSKDLLVFFRCLFL
mgnify:CR=1 FL=1